MLRLSNLEAQKIMVNGLFLLEAWHWTGAMVSFL